MSSRASRTIYVGNLPGDIREREVEDLFYKDNGSKGDIEKKLYPTRDGRKLISYQGRDNCPGLSVKGKATATQMGCFLCHPWGALGKETLG